MTDYRERNTLIELYEEQQLSPDEIGARYGVQGQTVRKWLHQHGIPVRQSQLETRFRPGLVPTHAIEPPAREELAGFYSQGMTAREIAGRYGVTSTTVLNWMEQYGLERRQHRNQAGWEPDPEILRSLYWDHWLTYEQIASRLGVDLTAIPYWFDKHGIPKRSLWETRRGAGWVPPDTEVICHLYEAEEMGMASVGKMLGVSRSYVKSVLADNGVTLRRSGYPNVSRFTAQDGHRVKSGLELQVDNWLSRHGIDHVYEPPIGSTRYRSDFLAGGRYIEIWGITGNQRYERKRAKKLKEYERLQLPILSVYPGDFPHLAVLDCLLAD